MVTTLTPFGEFLQSHIDQAYRAMRRTFVINPRNWWERKTNEWITALFVRAIQLKPVQEEIAYQMGGSTPLCRVLKDAISSYVDADDLDISADDVQGLEQAIENAMERLEIDATMVNGLESFVQEVIDDSTIDASKIDGLDAEKIEGFDEAVYNAVVEQMAAVGDEAQEVEDGKQTDLELEVRTIVTDTLEDLDVADEVAKKVGKILADKLTS